MTWPSLPSLPPRPPRPPLPWERRREERPAASVASRPTITSEGCEYGIECLKNHFLRAHLYMSEAIRFSSGGTITEGARGKVRLAREQLMAEDDFQEALRIEPPLRYKVLQILASCRSWWKEVEREGLDVSGGTIEDLQTATDGVKALYEAIYNLDREFRAAKA